MRQEIYKTGFAPTAVDRSGRPTFRELKRQVKQLTAQRDLLLSIIKASYEKGQK